MRLDVDRCIATATAGGGLPTSGDDIERLTVVVDRLGAAQPDVAGQRGPGIHLAIWDAIAVTNRSRWRRAPTG
jgi:hypothetical protein